MTEPSQFENLKIARIETFTKLKVGFVRVVADTGDEGWGQVSTYNADITCQILHRQVAPWALGEGTGNLDLLLDTIYEREHKFPGSYMCRALAGLDTAIWDLRGKRQGKPVVEILGGTPGPLRVYGSSMKRDITPEQELKRFQILRDSYGYDAFKFRVGDECGRDVDHWPGRTEAIVPCIRNGLDDQVALLVDANSGFSPPRAIEVGRMLEDNGISHFEEPCPYWELEQTKQVTDALNIDVTGGEQDCYLPTWRRMIEMRAVDIVQPDICYVGGISRALRVSEMAKPDGLSVTPHAANLSMVTIFTMHFLKAIENAGKYLEFAIEGEDVYPWQQGLFLNPPFHVADGHVTVPSEPGWGVEINPDWLNSAEYQKSELT